jgi:predicted secreted protein
MAIRGQNFRIFIGSAVFAGSTNCTVNLSNNTDDTAIKDTAGIASTPQVTSKSWTVNVETLHVLDVTSILVAIKNKTKFLIWWTETTGSRNQTPVSSIPAFARQGEAIITDATFNFNNRENSVKNITFTGIGKINTLQDGVGSTIEPAFTKGQNVRLFLSPITPDDTPTSVIAAARTLSLHVSVATEDISTKDTDGEWSYPEPTQITYDITTSALVGDSDNTESQVGGIVTADIMYMYLEGKPCKWQICNTSGANNRTKGTVIASGSVVLNSLNINAAVRQVVTYEAQMQGYGEYTVSS